jgi:hypothetical protein
MMTTSMMMRSTTMTQRDGIVEGQFTDPVTGDVAVFTGHSVDEVEEKIEDYIGEVYPDPAEEDWYIFSTTTNRN